MRTYPNADRPLCEVHVGERWWPGEIRGEYDDGRLNVKWSQEGRNFVETVSGERVRRVDLYDAVLAFEEEARWKYTGAKEVAVRERFDLSLATYHQVLNVAIDVPEQEAKRPMTVRRLRRLREERRKVRGA